VSDLKLEGLAAGDAALPPMPICAQCGRPVERMDWQWRPYLNAVEFVVYCHGVSEQMFLDSRTQIEMIGNLEPGVAFRGPRQIEQMD
jgi:hypothetical protein